MIKNLEYEREETLRKAAVLTVLWKCDLFFYGFNDISRYLLYFEICYKIGKTYKTET